MQVAETLKAVEESDPQVPAKLLRACYVVVCAMMICCYALCSYGL